RSAVPPGAEPGPRLAQLRTGEHQHEDRQVPGPVNQGIEEFQQALVGELSILDQQRHRMLGGDALEEQPPPREQLLPAQPPPRLTGPPLSADTSTPSSRPSRAPTYPRSAGSRM